ncbi:hypothetical protein [Marinifilum caeruleilacunae]|uniref:Uncharacterized protein n=1 Tax=Marinifilum caeruleilacunae TaxID=2499076 RepID=A0ABX1WXG2_9BACT|nr:hypothetical protein [Marinifilum caeruleilacunae]NOU60809.1 hypothetical protein [Marinifilum caeruleilacunae]
MADNTKEIQEARAKLKQLILDEVKPMRKKLDDLLNKEAERLCPFAVGDIIILDNGKKGIIKEINYYSLNYDFGEGEEFDFIERFDDIEYIYAYMLDDKKFSITWSVSGLRMINNGTEEGKVPFRAISPDKYEIDISNKIVKRKTLNGLVADEDFLTNFGTIE